MKRPEFLLELGHPSNRPKLWFSVRSGYVITLLFGSLALLAPALGLMPFSWVFAGIVGFKLLTNTAAVVSLKLDKAVLDTATFNVCADVLCMTAAIHATGGQTSPLTAIYAIEITVVALLSNLGTTALVAAGILICYAAMSLATHLGWLAQNPTPWQTAGGVTTGYLVVDLVLVVLVVLGPTFYVSAILRMLKAKERALEARTEELMEASRAKAQFMANVTHELRTPIHGLCGLSDLVSAGVYGPVTAEQQRAQRDIKLSAQNLLRQIDDLLELSRSDAGRLEYRPADVDLNDLLPATLAQIRWMQGTKELSLELELEADLPHIRTDRYKLNQVLLNLLANAVKFTPEGGSVSLGARRRADRVELLVRDTGVGIPEAELSSVFKPFHQVDGSSERAFGGVGLGLALVQRLVTLLGGDVTVQSQVGQGSEFAVSLPVAGPDAKYAPHAASDDQPALRAAS